MLPDKIVAQHISCQTLTLWDLIHFTELLQSNLRSEHIACHHVVLYE